MVREFNPDDSTTVGPRATNGGAPLPLATIANNMIRAEFGSNVTFTYADWRAVADERSFWSRVADDGQSLMARRSTHPSFQGLDQSDDDPYYHYLIHDYRDVNRQLTNMTDIFCYKFVEK